MILVRIAFAKQGNTECAVKEFMALYSVEIVYSRYWLSQTWPESGPRPVKAIPGGEFQLTA